VSSATPQEITEGREVLFETAETYEREIEDDHVGVLMGYYISPDVEDATAKAHKFVTRHRPDAYFTEYSATGPVEHIAEMINKYAEAGAYKFVVRPLCSADETMEQLEIMGSEVLPMFHK
jgi:hypothetical protein